MLKQKINKWLYEKTRNMLRRQAKVVRKTLEVEGYNIAYLESTNKSKKTLILIHGLNDEKETWLMLAAKLKDRYHLILIDLLGCGESDLAMDFEYTLRKQADFLEKIIINLMEEKKLKSFCLAGHSMGGLVILLADKLPIEKLILIDTLGIHVKLTSMQIEAQKIGDAEKLPFLNLTNKKQLKEAMKTSMYKPLYMPNFMLEHILARKAPLVEFERKKFHYVVDENMLHKDNLEVEIKNIKQETLIVWGKEDLGIDVASAYNMDELIENSTLKVYEECRHYPHVEKPKELARDIIEFLG
jgi:pimeloyl-ACP methyl ester carboxylesterase